MNEKTTETATGLTPVFGYLLGRMFANLAIGVIVDMMGRSSSFILTLVACALIVLFLAMSLKQEQEDKAERFSPYK